MEPEVMDFELLEDITPSQSASQVTAKESSIIAKRKAMEFKNIWFYFSKLKGVKTIAVMNTKTEQ
jgi:hypothetical protein